tara:strand:+ start:4481 stop:4945 length:465 start_codon:yes stop_codon:yes gene_type:complete
MSCKNNYNNISGTSCNIDNLQKKELRKYQKMQDSSHYISFKKNLAILNQVPNQSSNTAVGGNGDKTSSVQKGNKKSGVDKKHGSYARYLASKTARAGHCPLNSTTKTTYTDAIANTTVANGKCKKIKIYMDFLRHYRCHQELPAQIKALDTNSC